MLSTYYRKSSSNKYMYTLHIHATYIHATYLKYIHATYIHIHATYTRYIYIYTRYIYTLHTHATYTRYIYTLQLQTNETQREKLMINPRGVVQWCSSGRGRGRGRVVKNIQSGTYWAALSGDSLSHSSTASCVLLPPSPPVGLLTYLWSTSLTIGQGCGTQLHATNTTNRSLARWRQHQN